MSGRIAPYRRGADPGTRGSGFTLVELLVVIAIIALLLTLLTPTLWRARDLARIAVCLTNHRTIVVGLISYHSEHRTFPYNYAYYGSYSGSPRWALGYISEYVHGPRGVQDLRNRDEGEFPRAYICPAADLSKVYLYNPSDKYHACYWTNVAIRVNRGWGPLFNDYTGQGHPPGWDADSGGEARFTGKCCPRCGGWRSVYCPTMTSVPNPERTVFSGCTNNDFPKAATDASGDFVYYKAHDSYGNECQLYCQVYHPGFWHMRPGWGRVTGGLSLDRHIGQQTMSYLDGSAKSVTHRWIDENWTSFYGRPGDYVGEWQLQFPPGNVCSGPFHDRIHPIPNPIVE